MKYAGGATLGEALDDVLKDLYLWCVAEDVPVLTHSRMTNGPTADFKKLAGLAYWKATLADPRFAKLRISFGHLGDLTDDLNSSGAPPDATGFVNLMSEGDGAAGSHALQTLDILRR